jgi:hypothetical protein
VIRYQPAPAIAGRAADIRAAGLEEALFLALSDLVPAGGHLMVEYDSPAQRESERILTLDYPPVTSPLGYLLFRAGCRSFRDWYISEGGREVMQLSRKPLTRRWRGARGRWQAEERGRPETGTRDHGRRPEVAAAVLRECNRERKREQGATRGGRTLVPCSTFSGRAAVRGSP